jgi:hypothetical protein
MSSNDKTREKLMESMRKTKAGAVKKTVEADSKPEEKKTIRKKAKKADKKKVSKPAQPGGDPYQSGQRIWPD